MRRHAPSQAGRSTCSLLRRFLTTPTIARELAVSCFSFFCVFFIPTSFAQDNTSLKNLIFEPVLISAEPLSSELDDQPPTYPIVTEITSLPKGDGVEVDEWLTSQNRKAIAGSPESLQADIVNFEKAIATLELDGGPFNVMLSEVLLGLASAYQQAGSYDQAQLILDRAAYINRVNYGLYNTAQIPFLKRSIENHLLMGDILAADQQHEYLFYIQNKLHEDSSVEILPALDYYAQWNLFAATSELISAPTTPTETLTTSGAGTGPEIVSIDTAPVDMQSFHFNHLLTAQNIYNDIRDLIANNFGEVDVRMFEVQNNLMKIYALFANSFNSYITNFDVASSSGFGSDTALESTLVRRRDQSYRDGITILENRIQQLQSSNDPIALAQPKIELADWHLYFTKRMAATELYEEVHQELINSGVEPSVIDSLFSPDLPKKLPISDDLRYTRGSLNISAELPLNYKGFIDLEFNINRFGETNSVTLLGANPTPAEEIQSRLFNHIESSLFRPRLTAGKVRTSDKILARFYYTY